MYAVRCLMYGTFVQRTFYSYIKQRAFFLLLNYRKMLPNLPFYIAAVFIVTTAATVWLLARAMPKNQTMLIIISLWAAFQAVLGLSGFYKNTEGFPPRLALLGVPMLLLIIGLLTTERGRNFIQQIDLQRLTVLSVVRIPVEIVLLWLFQNAAIPQLMTFEGRNFDILAGLTAPIIAVVAFQNGKFTRRNLLIGWHIVCLLLLRVQIVTECHYGLFGQLNLCLCILPTLKVWKLDLFRKRHSHLFNNLRTLAVRF